MNACASERPLQCKGAIPHCSGVMWKSFKKMGVEDLVIWFPVGVGTNVEIRCASRWLVPVLKAVAKSEYPIGTQVESDGVLPSRRNLSKVRKTMICATCKLQQYGLAGSYTAYLVLLVRMNRGCQIQFAMSDS
jgi:hypothetical protein